MHKIMKRYLYQIYLLIKYKTTYFNYKFMHYWYVLFLFQFSFNFSFVFLHKDQGSLLPFFWPLFIILQNRTFFFKLFIYQYEMPNSHLTANISLVRTWLLLLYPPFFSIFCFLALHFPSSSSSYSSFNMLNVLLALCLTIPKSCS